MSQNFFFDNCATTMMTSCQAGVATVWHMREDDPLTYEIIGAAIEVSRTLGTGLLESVYETCLAEELKNRRMRILRQVGFPVSYKGVKLDLAFRAVVSVSICATSVTSVSL